MKISQSVLDERNDIAIRSRKHIDVTGVKEVLSFDDSSVSMVTVCGEMNVEGEDLKIGTLDTDSGIVSVDGKNQRSYILR